MPTTRTRKESLNSDGQQFYQYQQNEESHITSNNLFNKNHDMTLNFKVMAWDRHLHMARLHW
jgi:hypothetical protein